MAGLPYVLVAGRSLQNVRITIGNDGTQQAPGTLEDDEGGYFVDLALSRSRQLRMTLERTSEQFRDGMLLTGGRRSRTPGLAPGATDSYTATVLIPYDTPPGEYCLGVIVDPARKVREGRENNNTNCAPVFVGRE